MRAAAMVASILARERMMPALSSRRTICFSPKRARLMASAWPN